MRKSALAFALISAASLLPAQNLTPAQKDADFRYLASLYAVYYAPADWKLQLFNFNVLDIQPWLDRVAQTKTDLDFYEVCVEYVAGLNDTHDHFTLPSDFSATLGFTTDIYDGVLLIDALNRTQLPLANYPFTIGDELVSVDGQPVQSYLDAYAKYVVYANPIAAKRAAAARITTRPQSRMPHATDLLEAKTATVVIRRQSGALETYTIPWAFSGTPLAVGPVPSPRMASARRKAAAQSESAEPAYMQELIKAQWSGIENPEQEGLNGYGARNPVFVNGLAGFQFTRRFGGSTSDFYYSGTFKFDELTIGYIRIPNYSPPSTTLALTQFEQEMAFMNQNTDGLIVDEMRNTGGSLCFGEEIAARLIPYPFRATGFQLRPYWSRVLGFYNSWNAAKNSGAPQKIVDQYQSLYQAMLTANQAGKLVTPSLPLCSSSLNRDPLPDRNGNLIAYVKPIIMLIDEFSTSTADSVPGMFQDAHRGWLLGVRTNGAGGNNTTFDSGSYSEGTAGMTLALQARQYPVSNPGYPISEYIENVGVWPEVPVDYMTKENLLQNGAPFIRSFLQHLAFEIRKLR
jgi:peptidase S41-like protein/PDZ domain-containing protein